MSQRKQARISAFFPLSPPTNTVSKKRGFPPIDLTEGSDSEATPPPKRSRSDGQQESSRAAGAKEAIAPQILGKYGYQAGDTATKAPRTPAQQARHEAFKRRLLQDNSSFLPTGDSLSKGSLALKTGEPSNPLDETLSSDSECEESDDAFANMTRMWANPSQKGSTGKAPAPTRPAKRAKELGPSGKPYTPLELQVRDLKAKNPGTVLMIEVGYKYKFFGDDAKVASKELGMVSFPDRNYLVASIPTHRRDVHLKKLLAQGYKVGIVNQTETAALKKIGDNKSGPFERERTKLYTAATYVDDLNSVDETEDYNPPPFMCLVESEASNSPEVTISLISICPATGDVLWDEFKDTPMRIELEVTAVQTCIYPLLKYEKTRLAHIQPSEILLPETGLTVQTSKMLKDFSGLSRAGERIRTERFSRPMSYTTAFDSVSTFFTDKTKSGVASESFRSGQLIAQITDFPHGVVVALAHAVKYLSDFGIADALFETKFFTKFGSRVHMLLTANTLTNLEIYRNDTDYSVKGSLISVLDRTKTKFGARLLRTWVGRPLTDKRVLQQRVDAIEEIIESDSETLVTLRETLKGLPDLAKALSRIQYGQCTPQELAFTLRSFNKIGIAFDQDRFTEPQDVGFKSSLLNELIFALPKVKGPVQGIISQINLARASEGKMEQLWNDFEKYPEISDTDMAIQAIEIEIRDELKKVRKQLRMPALQWASWGGEDYLVELRKKEKRPVPDSWNLVSSTKVFARYRTKEVQALLNDKAGFVERLEAAARKAFQLFLKDIVAEHYAVLRDAINKLAVADCLLSLAQVALQEGYVRPQFVDEDVLEIIEGRHPMVEVLRSDPYIPNTIKMGDTTPRNKIITGPNMGGKSSCVRMIALIAIMAQIGSYVPAKSVKMKLIDSVLTRMGASDDITRGRSTFMVEMSETSEILKTATKDSLVILDELGRGTSTFDGMAIADAVLRYLVQDKGCKTLFITHYPIVASDLERIYPKDIQNLHMRYHVDTRLNGVRTVSFLYQLASGLAPESFGIECGRLAGLPESLLQTAMERSDQLRQEVEARVKRNRTRKATKLICEFLHGKANPRVCVEELKALVTPADH